jgi:hypothetical protein
MRYTVVHLPGSLNESGVAVYIVVDTGDPTASVGVAVARCPDGPGAIAVATALNEA